MNRYFQSRPEIFANLSSDGSRAAVPAIASAAMNRASDATSKIISAGLRHAAASNSSASRPNVGGGTTVSSFLHGVPFFFDGEGGGERS